MKLRTISFALGLVVCLGALPSLAREPMATFGEVYVGPKTMTVELAPTAKGDKVLLKVYGVNHPWNGRVFLATVRKGDYQRAEYVVKNDGADYVIYFEKKDEAPSLFLPGLGQQPLIFDRGAALQLQPEHLMTEYEDQPKAK